MAEVDTNEDTTVDTTVRDDRGDRYYRGNRGDRGKRGYRGDIYNRYNRYNRGDIYNRDDRYYGDDRDYRDDIDDRYDTERLQQYEELRELYNNRTLINIAEKELPDKVIEDRTKDILKDLQWNDILKLIYSLETLLDKLKDDDTNGKNGIMSSIKDMFGMNKKDTDEQKADKKEKNLDNLIKKYNSKRDDILKRIKRKLDYGEKNLRDDNFANSLHDSKEFFAGIMYVFDRIGLKSSTITSYSIHIILILLIVISIIYILYIVLITLYFIYYVLHYLFFKTYRNITFLSDYYSTMAYINNFEIFGLNHTVFGFINRNDFIHLLGSLINVITLSILAYINRSFVYNSIWQLLMVYMIIKLFIVGYTIYSDEEIKITVTKKKELTELFYNNIDRELIEKIINTNSNKLVSNYIEVFIEHYKNLKKVETFANFNTDKIKNEFISAIASITDTVPMLSIKNTQGVLQDMVTNENLNDYIDEDMDGIGNLIRDSKTMESIKEAVSSAIQILEAKIDTTTSENVKNKISNSISILKKLLDNIQSTDNVDAYVLEARIKAFFTFQLLTDMKTNVIMKRFSEVYNKNSKDDNIFKIIMYDSSNIIPFVNYENIGIQFNNKLNIDNNVIDGYNKIYGDLECCITKLKSQLKDKNFPPSLLFDTSLVLYLSYLGLSSSFEI